jgi:hypothetical protein
MTKMIHEGIAAHPMTAQEYLLRRHTDACVENDTHFGDPWNIYFRIGAISAWLYLTNRDMEEKMTLEDWDMTDLREQFWTFSNEFTGRQIVPPVA